VVETEGQRKKPGKKGGKGRRERREEYANTVTNLFLLQAYLTLPSAESWGQSLKPEDDRFIPNWMELLFK
jgi:hypothetical protein